MATFLNKFNRFDTQSIEDEEFKIMKAYSDKYNDVYGI